MQVQRSERSKRLDVIRHFISRCSIVKGNLSPPSDAEFTYQTIRRKKSYRFSTGGCFIELVFVESRLPNGNVSEQVELEVCDQELRQAARQMFRGKMVPVPRLSFAALELAWHMARRCLEEEKLDAFRCKYCGCPFNDATELEQHHFEPCAPSPRPVAAPVRHCGVCYEEYPLPQGGLCTCGNHFWCSECLQEKMISDSKDNRTNENVSVTCCAGGCFFEPRVVVAVVPKEIWELHLASGIKSRERAIVREMDALYAQRERDKAALTEKEQEIRRRVDHILQEILTKKCPECGAAFHDFTNCFALQCMAPGCRAHFCGWCLAFTGEDAHRHVVNCEASLRSGQVFADAHLHTEAMRNLQIKRLRLYLPQIPLHREDILKEVRGILHHHQITVLSNGDVRKSEEL